MRTETCSASVLEKAPPRFSDEVCGSLVAIDDPVMCLCKQFVSCTTQEWWIRNTGQSANHLILQQGLWVCPLSIPTVTYSY